MSTTKESQQKKTREILWSRFWRQSLIGTASRRSEASSNSRGPLKFIHLEKVCKRKLRPIEKCLTMLVVFLLHYAFVVLERNSWKCCWQGQGACRWCQEDCDPHVWQVCSLAYSPFRGSQNVAVHVLHIRNLWYYFRIAGNNAEDKGAEKVGQAADAVHEKVFSLEYRYMVFRLPMLLRRSKRRLEKLQTRSVFSYLLLGGISGFWPSWFGFWEAPRYRFIDQRCGLSCWRESCSWSQEDGWQMCKQDWRSSR